ncbi:MAG: hypothetical protein RIC38_06200 [Chromatocurvus sp.]
MNIPVPGHTARHALVCVWLLLAPSGHAAAAHPSDTVTEGDFTTSIADG